MSKWLLGVGSWCLMLAVGVGLGKAVQAQTPAVGLWPPSVTLNYAVTGQKGWFSVTGTLNMQWQLQLNRYEARMTTDLLRGLYRSEQQSQGLWAPSGIQPQRFVERKKNRSNEVVFDALQQQVTYPQKQASPWPVSGQDRLSIFFALGPLLQPALAAQQRQLTVPVSGVRDWEPWVFDIQPSETVRTEAGEWAAVLLQKKAADSGQTISIWLAKNLQWLPVRIRIEEGNQEWVDQQLTSVQWANP